ILKGSTVSFGSTLNGAFDLAITGNAVFGGLVGNTNPLTSLTVTGTASIGNSISTTGIQDYQSAATLTGAATLAGSTVTFESTLNGAQALAISGNAVFDDVVGGSNALSSLSVSGTSSIANDITTSGIQTYTGAATLTGTVDLTSGSTVGFGSTLAGGGNDLTVSGNASFGGNVSNLGTLDVTGTTAINASAINTTGFQTYGGNVTLGANTTLTAGALVDFAGTVSSTSAKNLTVTNDVEFDNTVGGSGNVLGSLTVGGITDINTNAITTSGIQDYKLAVTLATGPVTLGGSTVMFESTLDGAFNLAVNGNAVFDAAVGGINPLNKLTVSGTATIGTAGNVGSVSTVTTQTYGGAVTLVNGTTNLTAGGTGVTFNSTLTGGGSNLNLLGTTDVTFNGAATGLGAVAVGGNATFGANVSLTSLVVTGTTTLGANVSSSGDQTYTGAVTLNGNSGITVTGAGNEVQFKNTVDSNGSGSNKTLTVTGNAEFDNAVGSNSRLGSLTVTGATTIDTNFIQTVGTQSYGGAVTLMIGTDLTSQSGTVSFGAAVGGNVGLTVSGNSAFDGVVNINNLDVTGNTTIATTSITTINSQTYGGSVTLDSNTTLQSTGKLITIDGSIGGGEDLTLNTGSGGVSLLGGADKIGTLKLGETGTLTLRGTFDLTKLDTGSMSGSLVLAGNTQLDLGSSLVFNSLTGGITGSHSLGISDGSDTVNLTNVTVSVASVNMSAGTLKLADVTTTQGQTYKGAVTLTGAMLKNSSSGDISVNGALIVAADAGLTNDGGGIDLKGTVDGDVAGRSLTLHGDAVTLGGTVGGKTALGSLAVTAGTISLQAVTTSGTQTYDGVASVNADLTGQGLSFSHAVNILNPVLMTADAIKFDGGNGSVTGTTTLAIVSRTADLGITIGTGSSGLVLNADALGGYAGLLYVGAVPIAGGVSNGVLGKEPLTPGQLGGDITVNSPLKLANGGSLILVSGGSITLTGNANDFLSAGTVVLAASDNLVDTNGNAGITSDNIVLAGRQIGLSAADSIAIYPLGINEPILQVGSGTTTSNIGGEIVIFSEQQGGSATDAATYDADVDVTPVNSNNTNASQQSATNQQTGGLLGSGFIDVSVFQQISLYDVNGSGIQLPSDQCEEESATGTGCGQ
ncbi:MAG TPA: hypothetical protein VGH91_10260, partial [Gammaproteobacteria bacterium]